MDSDLIQLDDCVASAFGPSALKLIGAKDCLLFGSSGRKYVDLISGWNVANLGWAHPVILKRVMAQMRSLPLAPAWCIHDPALQLCELISSQLGDEIAVLRAPTGTQAVEFALRVARRATGRRAVVSVAECYHGSTQGSLAASGIPALWKENPALVEWHRVIPLPGKDRQDAASIRAQIVREPVPAAVLMEPFFTNAGAIIGDRAYYQEIAAAARECGALLVMDEVGTGLGRVGRLFGFQEFELTPDLFVLGKSLGGGVVPMAAVAMKKALRSAVGGLAFDSTFAGTPAGCEAALATLDLLIRTDLLEQARIHGKAILRKLQLALNVVAIVRDVRGLGLLIGIEFEGSPAEQSRMSSAVVDKLLHSGLFAAKARYSHALLLMPPLTISERQSMRCVDVIIEIISQLDAAATSDY